MHLKAHFIVLYSATVVGKVSTRTVLFIVLYHTTVLFLFTYFSVEFLKQKC